MVGKRSTAFPLSQTSPCIYYTPHVRLSSQLFASNAIYASSSVLQRCLYSRRLSSTYLLTQTVSSRAVSPHALYLPRLFLCSRCVRLSCRRGRCDRLVSGSCTYYKDSQVLRGISHSQRTCGIEVVASIAHRVARGSVPVRILAVQIFIQTVKALQARQARHLVYQRAILRIYRSRGGVNKRRFRAKSGPYYSIYRYPVDCATAYMLFEELSASFGLTEGWVIRKPQRNSVANLVFCLEISPRISRAL